MVIEVTGLEALKAGWDQAPQQTAQIMSGAVMDALVYLQGELQQQLPAGAGGQALGLRASVETELSVEGEAVNGEVFSTLPYAGHVEFGTRPHMPPLAPIKEWARAVLGDETAAYPIALKIAAVGTPAQPIWAQVNMASESIVRSKLEAGVDRVAQMLSGNA